MRIGGDFALGRPGGVLASAAVRLGQEDIRFYLLTPHIDFLALVLQGDRLRSDHLTTTPQVARPELFSSTCVGWRCLVRWGRGFVHWHGDPRRAGRSASATSGSDILLLDRR